MASNIKLSTIGTSAGLNTATTTVSGSYVANVFLTGSVGAGLRDLPDTTGTLSGTSARPVGQQYEFIEFDGKLPSVSIDTITSPDTSSPNSGKRVDITITISGVRSGETGKIYVWINGQNTGEYYYITAASNGTGIPHTILDSTNTYIVPNSINTIKLVLTIDGTSKTANDSKTVYVYPLDLTILSITQTPSLSGASTYNYTTGSIAFSASVAGGVTPYIYNWNTGASSANPFTFDNSTTTTDKQITLVVTDSNSPTADTANGTSLPIMRKPITVSISNASVSEPYVAYTLSSTVNYNVEPAAITYGWDVASGTGYLGGSAYTSANPVVYYTTLGSKTHRLNITGTNNASIRNHNTSNTTVQVSPTTNVVVTYSPGTEKWSATFDSVIDATYGTRTYEYQGRSKDAGGTYTAWGSSITVTNNSISAQSFAGKTDTAQYLQIRVRVRRTYSTFDEVSAWAESNEALVPVKGIITMSNQTNLLTNGDRTFDGSVALGGVADTNFSEISVTSNNSVVVSGAKPSSNILRITVNNPCTAVGDGTSTHVATVKDGNGYYITKSFTAQFKINTSAIGLSPSWYSGAYYNDASNRVSLSIATGFDNESFAYKVGSGGTYSALNGGTLGTSTRFYWHNYGTAPTSDQTWYYRIAATGGTYTKSDILEVSMTTYGYPNQSYGYSVVTILASGAEATSGTLSQGSGLKLRVKRTSGGSYNFNGISAAFYATRAGSSTVDFTDSLTEAQITDSAAYFESSAYDLYNSTNFYLGDSAETVELVYTITPGIYKHRLTNTFTLNREPGSFDVSKGTGFNGVYAIRSYSFTIHATYLTYGPPYYSPNAGYYYVYMNTSRMASMVENQSNRYDTNTGYFRTNTTSTYGRYTVSTDFTKTESTVGTYNYDFWGNEYTPTPIYVNGILTSYTYYINGSSEFNSPISIVVKERPLKAASCSWSLVVYATKGVTGFELGLGSGTLTGDYGTVDRTLDNVTYVFQRYNGSSWVDLAGSSYDSGAFGTTQVRVKFTDAWGNVFTSNSQDATTTDFDYSFNLSHNNYTPDVYAYTGPSQTSPPLLLNAASYTLKNAIISSGTSVTVTNAEPNTIVVASEHTVDGMDYKSSYSGFNGAYTTISVSVTGGNTPSYGMFRTFNYTKADSSTVRGTQDFEGNPFGGISSLTKKSFQMFNSGDTTGNTLTGTSINWYLMAVVRSPTVLGATATYRIHGQKSSTNTDQPSDYYIIIQNRAAVNQLTFYNEIENCGTTTVVFRTGQIDTATTLIIEESTDNSTWSAVTGGTYSGLSANTNYSATITTTTGQTKYYRARLTDGSNTLITVATDTFGGTLSTYNAGNPTNATISVTANCTKVNATFNASNVYWTIYSCNSQGSVGSYTQLYQGTNSIVNYLVDGYFVIVWYRSVAGCTSTTSTSQVYYTTCSFGCGGCA